MRSNENRRLRRPRRGTKTRDSQPKGSRIDRNSSCGGGAILGSRSAYSTQHNTRRSATTQDEIEIQLVSYFSTKVSLSDWHADTSSREKRVLAIP